MSLDGVPVDPDHVANTPNTQSLHSLDLVIIFQSEIMAFSSYFIVISIAGITFILGMLFIKSIHRNTHKRREMRKILLKRAETLRLPKMLQALGISFSNYFYKISVDEIDKSITQCEKCSSTDLCDEKLKLPELNPGDIDFCPSQQHLSKFSRENRVKK